jgi:serine protease inhibitor
MKTVKSNDCGVDSSPTVPTTSPSTTLADVSSLAVISDLEKVPILEAQADFALKVLRAVLNQLQYTTIISPISVAIALSAVYAGAKDETAEQMNKLLANGLIYKIKQNFSLK